MTGGKKPLEKELKLILPGPEAETVVVDLMRAQGYRLKALSPVTNVDLYLDTFDWLLMRKKLSLRYRLSDGKALYTIKSLEPIEAGIAIRRETEVVLDKPAARPTDIDVKQIGNIIDEIIAPRKLLEQIQIRTERRRYRIISPESAKFELAFDQSSFLRKRFHPRHSLRKHYELEAELQDGPQSALESLAALFSTPCEYPPSTLSKFELAFERLKIAIPARKPPARYLVRPEDRLDLAVRKILTYQLQKFNEQIPGIERDLDTEFVHQARVAMRRMRSCLRLFHAAVPLSTGGFFAAELKWLGGLLGEVRDLDVFLLNLSHFQPQIGRFPEKQRLFFEHWIAEHRQGPLTALNQAFASPRYRNLEKRLTRFLNVPLPERPRAPMAVKQVHQVAPLLINKKFTAVMDQGRAVLEDPKLKQFHLLRIQMKKLRYVCEFLSPAYDGALDTFIERTVEIQDCLGDIQDTVFTRDFIDTLLAAWRRKIVSPNLLFVLGEIYQLQLKIAADRERQFGKIWERFASEETIGQLKETLRLDA